MSVYAWYLLQETVLSIELHAQEASLVRGGLSFKWSEVGEVGLP